MQCLSNCFSFFMHSDSVNRAKNVRDNFLTGFEKANMCLVILLLIFSLIFMITGLLFMNQDVWNQEVEHSLISIKDAAIALIFSYIILLPMFGGTGVLIIKNRTTPCLITFLWGFLLFFIVAIPLMAEGTLYYALDTVEIERI